MKFIPEQLYDQLELREAFRRTLEAGKRIVILFTKDEDKVEFIHTIAKITASRGRLVGGAVGAAVAGAVGGAAAVPLGIAIGAIIGNIVGYALGVWLAHFIYRISQGRRIKTKELFSWFGLRKNRVQLALEA
ncbi:MAG: hypothetical protein DSM106950_04050 [Stigonema ocellatum SAG 48.90 = DSM 106950]|nr:hypothetical protein [Stigonema ocellatum SAG 48.90 = DSM 106950]